MTDNFSNKPKMYILAGANGSGKTSVLLKEIPREITFLNADEFSREIAKFQNSTGLKIQSDINDKEALQLALAGMRESASRMQQAIQKSESFATETTLDVKGYAKHIENAKSKGFEVELLYAGTTSPFENIKRVSMRVLQGGHSVPEEKIVQRYHGSLKRLSSYIEMVDKAQIYDNSLKNPRHILTVEHGKITERNEPIPDWVRESVIEKLHNEVQTQTIQDACKALSESGKCPFVVSPQVSGLREGKIIAKSLYYAVQEMASSSSIIYDLEKAPGLKNIEIGENVTLKYDHETGNAEIAAKTEKTEKNIDFDKDVLDRDVDDEYDR